MRGGPPNQGGVLTADHPAPAIRLAPSGPRRPLDVVPSTKSPRPESAVLLTSVYLL